MENTNSLVSNVIQVRIEEEMRGAYLDYSMSVIIGRALPDVRDGLKPVHRRVLYAMYDLGNAHDKPFKKSARVVGDVIGKYHPHGDTAVYDTIVRLAQDFSLRYPLVDGQGNFGSIDGDSAAAMRYTEVRMEKITAQILSDLEKDTVDFGPNYDDSLKEPKVLPAAFPNLLANGSSGIAVGMATNIPPHNLCELIDATTALIQDPTLTVDQLLEHVKGPDFPTAGILIGGSIIRQVYRTGKGVITIRGRAEIEPGKNDRERIIITELPYQVNKAKLIEKVADLVRDKILEGVSDLRDESDRTGMRVVIELKRGENAQVVLNRLYKLTQLQDSFGVSLLAIHEGRPKVFNLKEMLWAFIEHRKDVVTRRTQFELQKAKARAHILEGLKIALENIDEVIELIKRASSPGQAAEQLTSRFGLSALQATAILEMRLQRLTGMEQGKILEDYQNILRIIAELQDLLSSEVKIFALISTELAQVKEQFGDERRTEIIIDENSDFEIEDLIPDDPTLVLITHQGYIKRTDPAQFRSQHRGGRGIRAVKTLEDDFVTDVFQTTNLSSLLCFTNLGRVYQLKVYRVPENDRLGKGKAIVNLLSLQAGEKVCAILPIREFSEEQYFVMVTKNGVIKKTPQSDYKNIRTPGLVAMLIEEGDQLISARPTDGKKVLFLCSQSGMAIQFPEENVRSMGRAVYGVNGMDLDTGDSVVSMEVLDADKPETELLTVTEFGYGKRTPQGEYRLQTRAGKGVITMRTSEKNGKVIAALRVCPSDELMLVSNFGQMIRIKVGEISEQGRNTGGVRLMNVSDGERVVALERMAESAADAAPGVEGSEPA